MNKHDGAVNLLFLQTSIKQYTNWRLIVSCQPSHVVQASAELRAPSLILSNIVICFFFCMFTVNGPLISTVFLA